MNGECGQMPGMGLKGITRKNGRGLLLAGLNVGTWESDMYVCERSIQSGRRGADGLYTDGVVSSCIFHFFLWERNGLGGGMVSGERLGRKEGGKERMGRGNLNDSSAKTKICMERKQDLR